MVLGFDKLVFNWLPEYTRDRPLDRLKVQTPPIAKTMELKVLYFCCAWSYVPRAGFGAYIDDNA